MKKFELEYLKKRVNGVVRCTNGRIATIMEKQKKGTGLTDAKKYKMIATGDAVVATENDLAKKVMQYSPSIKTAFDALLYCFDYPTTESQKKKISHNKQVDDKIIELMNQVELEGKRLIDSAVLKIITADQIPGELHKLGEMANLARK